MNTIKNIAAAIKTVFTRKSDVRSQRIERRSSRHRHPKKNNLLRKQSGFKFQFLRFVSLLVIMTMLVTSNPAAPNTLAVSMGEMIQDVRFSYMANSGYISEFGSNLVNTAIKTNPIFGFFFGKKRKRQAAIAKIDVLPNATVIKEGTELVLNALALDSRGNAVQGTRFTWESVKRGRSRGGAKKIDNALFEGDEPGIYRITAKSRGATGTGYVVVKEDAEYRAMKEISEQEIDKSIKKGGQAARKKKRKAVRKEVADLMKEIRANRGNPVKSSSRMKDRDKTELRRVEKAQIVKRKAARKKRAQKRELKRQRNRSTSAPSRQSIAQNKSSKRKTKGASDGIRYLVSPEDKLEAEGEKKREAKTKKTKKTKRVTGGTITGVNTSNNAYGQVDGFFVDFGGGGGGGPFLEISSKSKRALNGFYYADVELWIDGPQNSGTWIGSTECNSSSCSWSIPIPPAYHDGQPHTLYAYAIDIDFIQSVLLSGSPKSFTIGTAATPEWNNDNFETSDDPGLHTGSPPNQGTSGAGSGNFGFSAPVVSLPGRNGLDVNLSLNYNSLLWHNDGDGNIVYDIDKGSPAPGWSIGFGKIMDAGSSGGAILEDPNGTRHSYEGDTVAGAPGYSTYYGRTTDGSFIDYKVARGPSGLISASAWFPDGTTIHYNSPNDGILYPFWIKDTSGNAIYIGYVNNQGPNISAIGDTLNRVISFRYDSSSRLIAIKGPGYNGTTQTYMRLHYTQKTLSASFSGLNKLVRNASPYQIDSIYYPVTNTGYWLGDSDSYSSYGMIKKVKQMRSMTSTGTDTSQGSVTAGTMSTQTIYNYPATASNLTTAPMYTTKTDTWSSMDTSAAVTNYSINNTANPRTTTITLPNGTKNKTYSYNTTTWNDGILYRTEFLSPTNAILSKQEMTWAQGYHDTTRVTQVLSTDEKNQTSKQIFTYGAYYNQVTSAKQYGYTNNLIRDTITSYENSANYRGNLSGTRWTGGWQHIFNLPLTVEIKNSSGVRESRVEYTYDQGTLINNPGVTKQEPFYNPYSSSYVSATAYRGNATKTKTYTNAASLTGAIEYNYTYDITGNNRTATTNCCQQIGTTYISSNHYAYPSSVRRGSPTGSDFVTTSATYDFNTGAVKTSTDANGRTTTAAYDSIGRPTQVTLSTGGKNTYGY